jgi:hypothetical protein
MAEAETKYLKERSDALQIRFVCAIFAGFLIFVFLWWSGEHGYKTATVVAIAAFVLTWLYAITLWVRLAGVRIKLRQARRGA